MPDCCFESFRDPSASNASCALATAIWSGRTITPMLLRIDRTWTEDPLDMPTPKVHAPVSTVAMSEALQARRALKPRTTHPNPSTSFATFVVKLSQHSENRSRFFTAKVAKSAKGKHR